MMRSSSTPHIIEDGAMTIFQLYPAPPRSAPLTPSDASVLCRWGGSTDSSTCALNIVTSLNGSLTDADGVSAGLSTPADRMLLGVIRGNADVVLVGAATARAEGYTLPSSAPLALLTRSGDLKGVAVDDWSRAIILCPPGTPLSRTARTAKVLPLPADGPSIIDAAIGSLHAAGFAHILVEGGGSVARELLESGQATDVFLTISPRFIGEGVGWLSPRGDRPATVQDLNLVHLLRDADQGALYTRWKPRG